MKNKFKLISCLIIFLVIMIFTNINYCADGALSASQTTSGDKITVNITSTKALGAFTLKASGLSSISGESDVGEYGGNSIAGVSMKGTKNLGKFVFSVPEKDTKVTFSVSGVADAENNDLSITSTTITLKGKKVETTTTDKKEDTTTDKNTSTTNKDTTTPEKPKEKSNNAYLSTLGVTPKEYDFSGFSKTKTEYSVTVPKNVDSLKVLYKTADSNAKVSVSGNSGFEVGSDNKITIKVTAEDGKTTKEYAIKVTQLAEEEEKPGNLIEDEEGLYLTNLNIDAATLSPEFNKEEFSYIKELKIEAVANKKVEIIDISVHSNLNEGENTINIILKMNGSETQTVYQVIVTANFTEDIIPETSEENENTGATDLIGKLKSYAGIAIGVIILIVVVVIVLIIMLIKENKRIKEDEKSDEHDETEKTKVKEYNVYENDDNEFLDNDIKKDNFIESLYNQRNGTLDTEDFTEEEKETLEEINKQTEKIFEEKVEGQSVEYISNEIIDNPLEEKNRKRGKGKHSL